MDYYDGWQRLNRAVQLLCGKESQAERLYNALSFSLSNIRPENDLPESFRDDFIHFMDEMTPAVVQGVERDFHDTVDEMDDFSISKSIEKIFYFYGLISS